MVVGELSADRWQRDVVQIRCDLEEPIDSRLLQESLTRLVARHEALRVKLEWSEAAGGDVVRQTVLADAPARLEVADLEDCGEAERDASVAGLLAASWRDRFDVVQPPRLQAMLLRFGPSRFRLLVTYQETVLDEHAGKLLVGELLDVYDALAGARDPRLAPAVPFHDYLGWLAANRETRACHFWGELLARAPAPSPPPLMGVGAPDGTTETCCGDLTRVLPESVTAALQAWVARHGATLNTALLAAWAVVVAHHAGQRDARFSAVFSLRGPMYPNANDAIAMCFTVLPFVVTGARSSGADDLLAAVRDHEREARRHGLVLDGSPATRRQLGQPGSQSLIFFDELEVEDFLYRAHPEWAQCGSRRFSLYGRNPYAMAMRGFGGPRMKIQAWYNPGSYSRTAIHCLLDQLVHVLTLLPGRGDRAVCSAGLLPAAHRRLSEAWSVGPARGFEPRPLHALMTEQARRAPDAPAVVGDGCTLTYAELDRRSNRLAHLLKEAGLTAGGTAAVHMSRTPEIVVAVFGILKAGGAYVPIDASWPAERVERVLRQLGTALVLTDASRATRVDDSLGKLGRDVTVVQLGGDGDRCATKGPGRASGSHWLGEDKLFRCPDTAPAQPVSADALAYIIFTSGSTGGPKGVAVRHRPVCNLIDWARRTFGFSAGDRALWVSSLAFDLSVFDLFGVLACGGSVRVVAETDLRSPQRLLELLDAERITFWNSAPQALERLRPYFETGGPPVGAVQGRGTLRLVFLSGDWIPLSLPDAVRSRFPGAEVISLGGATEATVWSNVFPVGAIEPQWRSIPYGKPIQNARYYVLDERRQPCGVGVAGELYIGGDVLADGYHADGQRTAERFVPDPFDRPAEPAARMYRTGDSARWWPDGNMELLGRLDNQVKVRGYRIELDEVEQALRTHDGVADAAVVARRGESGENQLVAYVVGAAVGDEDAPGVTYGGLRRHVQRILPEYMMPAIFVRLDALPLTPNGKVDRAALPSPGDGGVRAIPPERRAHAVPRPGPEATLARIFGDALKIDGVGAGDNFFELGGDSLSALGVIFAAEQAGLRVSIDMLRTTPVEALARHAAESAAQNPRRPALLQDVPDACNADDNNERDVDCDVPLVPSQRWLLAREFGAPSGYAFSAWLRSRDPLDVDALAAAWQAVNDHHEAMRLRFDEHGTDGDRWVRQRVGPPGSAAPVRRADLSNVAPDRLDSALEAEALALTRDARLAGGDSLARLLWVNAPGGADLLFLFIPHIITDEYSARIVIDDLGEACRLARSQRPIELPSTSVPFSAWARHVTSCAARPEVARELEAFCKLPWHSAGRLPRDQETGGNTYAHAQDACAELSRGATDTVLHAARSAGASVQSLLLTALAETLSEWSGADAVSVDLTGSGRGAVFGSPPAHRSTGFFSVIHPVLLARPRGGLGPAAVRAAEASLNAAPARGVTYGIIRYLYPDAEACDRVARVPAPQVKFNYHGLVPLCRDDGLFEPAGIPSPHLLRPADRRHYLLNVDVAYHDRRLQTTWRFSRVVHRPETIHRLATRYTENLLRCAAIGATS